VRLERVEHAPHAPLAPQRALVFRKYLRNCAFLC
jgi:hypothetical protein